MPRFQPSLGLIRGGAAPPEDTVQSTAMQRLLRRAALYANWRTVVVVQGEVGTGKSWLAKRIHQLSPRREKGFAQMSLAQPDLPLMGSELFGHVAGGFTDAKRDRPGLLASANHGTVFFDEVGKCPLPMQYKLLQVLDAPTFTPVGADRHVTVDVRFIFAAREPLEELVATGAMAPDFHSRLGLLTLQVPALRERRSDIVPLARWFVQRVVTEASERPCETVPVLSERLCKALKSYHWPGNVRELQNVIEKLVIHCDGDTVLDTSLLDGDLARYSSLAGDPASRRAERRAQATRALERSKGSKAEAATLLGWSRSTLQRVLRAN